MTTSFACQVQTLIESVIKDTQELQSLHKESRKRKIEKINALKKRHEELLRSKNKLHTVKLDLEDAHRKLHKEARTQEHYNNILINDKNQLIEKISEESKKKKKAEEILEEIKKEILQASVEYENCMSIMKQKQLLSARCKTDKVALEKELTKTKADLENIMLRINEENKTKGLYLDKIAVLHLECEQLKAKYTLKQANLLRIQQENTEIQRKIVEEKSGFETIKKNFELTQKLLHIERRKSAQSRIDLLRLEKQKERKIAQFDKRFKAKQDSPTLSHEGKENRGVSRNTPRQKHRNTARPTISINATTKKHARRNKRLKKKRKLSLSLLEAL